MGMWECRRKAGFGSGQSFADFLVKFGSVNKIKNDRNLERDLVCGDGLFPGSG